MAKNQTVYALRLFIDGKRIYSDRLSKKQARIFLMTARHLQKYLKQAYKLTAKKKKGRGTHAAA